MAQSLQTVFIWTKSCKRNFPEEIKEAESDGVAVSQGVSIYFRTTKSMVYGRLRLEVAVPLWLVGSKLRPCCSHHGRILHV